MNVPASTTSALVIVVFDSVSDAWFAQETADAGAAWPPPAVIVVTVAATVSAVARLTAIVNVYSRVIVASSLSSNPHPHRLQPSQVLELRP